MEYLDIRNTDGTLTGKVKERNLVHQDGDLHGTVHIFIVREGKEGRELLLQKRSKDKDAYPGCYDISSAGHVSAGQGYKEAALRELEEELGIHAEDDDLSFIGYYHFYCEERFYDKPFRNNEISAVYLYTKPVEIGNLILQEEEVESVCWMPLSACKEKVAQKDREYCLLEEELNLVEGYYCGRTE